MTFLNFNFRRTSENSMLNKDTQRILFFNSGEGAKINVLHGILFDKCTLDI